MIDTESLAAQIAEWMRNYAEQAGATGYVVGISGGVDSAVTAALATRAVGPEHTLCAWLPCQSQAEDARFAHMVIEALETPMVTVELTTTYETLTTALPSGPTIAYANIKPRLRMATLYFLAQANGYLVAGTGNKTELMVGYFTKYGDGGVDIEPLGELYKYEVRALAHVLGVPQPVIDRPPTAGLWPGQTDEGELGITYDELDAILTALACGEVPPAPVETVARVKQMIAASAHKRSMPPSYPVQR